jgi:hypothetical protein
MTRKTTFKNQTGMIGIKTNQEHFGQDAGIDDGI